MSLVLCISSPNNQPITHFDIFAQKEEAFWLRDFGMRYYV